jgi:hypothetical protein
MVSGVNSQMVIDAAVAAWNAGTDSIFEFCIEASYIVGRGVKGETIALGREIHRSPDTVERYAKAGLLWHAMLTKYPADSELMREALDYQFWLALAPLWHKNIISLEGVKQWFEEAITNKWEYEKFLTMIPKAKSLDSDWMKSAKKTALLIDDLCSSPAFGVDEIRYKAGIKILRIASLWLKGMTMTNVIDLLVNDGIANNVFRASAIANGLKLYELKTDDEKLARARLYRDWRNSQIFPKADTASCFEKAINGEAVPVNVMFDEVLHSEVMNDTPTN